MVVPAAAWGTTLDSGWIEEHPLQVHGFVSQGFIKSTGNNYLADSKRGSFELTEAALNFTDSLTDRLRESKPRL